MGCDIHWVLEQKHGDKWIGIRSNGTPSSSTSQELYNWLSGESTDVNPYKHESEFWDGRSYSFFAKLAGVRGEGPDPNGVPDDASDMSVAFIERWGSDGHSHGHLPAIDFVTRYLLTEYEYHQEHGDVDVQKRRDGLAKLFALRIEDPVKFEVTVMNMVDRWWSDDTPQMRFVFWFDN